MQNLSQISESILTKLENLGEEPIYTAFKKAIQDPSYKKLAVTIKTWETIYLNPNPKVRAVLKHEMQLLEYYFKEKGVAEFYYGKQKNPSRYYWEIGIVILGLFMIGDGINGEIHHSLEINYNSYGMMSVQTGAMTALLGTLLIITGCCSSYAKWKK